jgi:membrane-associated protease RseP (regulator of RpoE activity)
MASHFVWYELMTTDTAGAEAFYKTVIGWKPGPMPGMPYTIMKVGDTGVAGMMTIPEEAAKMGQPPAWVGYIYADDVDAKTESVGKAGGATIEKVDPITALGLGAKQSWHIVEATFQFMQKVFTGQAGGDQIGGPIRIAQLSGQAASLGLDYFMNLTAVISVSIGLLNLFPVPLLDGGHLMYYLVEIVRGRPLSERAQEMGFRVGLALVLMLMIFATYNDILHIRNIFKVAS